ncbi:MAG: NosD domain-containing protein [Methanolobus sp.]|nr:NosD domain-containing protein [Methanolobus sp.]
MIFLLLLCISFILSIGSATAGTVIVDCNGSGDYTSIQESIDNANAGDSIIVRSGTYTENLVVDKSVSIISESGNPADTTILSAVADDDVIHVTADNVTISGFNITRSDRSYLEEEYPDYAYCGIFLDRVEDSLIMKNDLSHNYKGVSLYGARNNFLVNNSAFSNNAGFSLDSSSENILTNNSATSRYNGINMHMSRNCSLLFNRIESCGADGISFIDSSNTTLTGNNIKHCDNGIWIGSSNENSVLTDNTVTSNNCGLFLFYSYYITISNNVVSDNSQSGFFIRNSLYNTLNSNIISNNSEYGMHFEYYAHSNLIYDNYFNNTNNARDGYSNTWSLIQTNGTNIVGGPYIGGNFWTSPDGTGFSQTQVDMDGNGICDDVYVIEGSNVDKLPLSVYQSDFIIVDCAGRGDYTSIQGAVNAAAEGATIIVRNGTYTENIAVNRTMTIISESGNPENVIIRPFDLENNLIAINADYVTLNGFTVTGANSSKAIFLYESTECLIENNIVESNQYGIYLNNSDNNEIVNNTLLSNSYIGLCLFESNNNSVISTSSIDDYIGFDLVNSCDNVLSENILESDGVYGMYFHKYSHNNYFTNNTILSTYYYEQIVSNNLNSMNLDSLNSVHSDEFDLYTVEYVDEDSNYLASITEQSLDSQLSGSVAIAGGLGLFLNKNNTNNVISGNLIEDNYIYGICFGNGSSENIIYNNYFNNNVNYHQILNNTNTWNITRTAGGNIVGGPYVGGNYWSTPSDAGFSQTHLDEDEDGICDDANILDENNIDYLPLHVSENTSTPAYFESIMYSGPDLSYIIENFGIERFDSNTGYLLKCLEFNSSNFAGFPNEKDENISTEVLRIYDDGNLTGRTVPANSLEYKTTMYRADFNATFDGYLHDGYPCFNLFGNRYVLLSIDSPDMLVKLVIDNNETITLSAGESVDLGEGFTFNLYQIDIEAERAWIGLERFGEFVEDEVVAQIDSDSTTWWYDPDLASEDDVIVFGVHVLDINSSSITISGLWLVDFEHIFAIKSGDEFGNLEVDCIESESISMRNSVPLVLERGTMVGIANDLSFEIADTTNLSFQLVKGVENGSVPNSAPIATIMALSPNLVFEGDKITFEGSGFDFDGTVVGYNWTSSIDGHLSHVASFSTSYLSVGMHTINFSVQDNEGVWSDEVSSSLIISNKRPQVNITFESQFGGMMGAVSTSENYTYAAQMQHIIVLDTSNTTNPLEVGRVLTPFEIKDIAITGNYAYVADAKGGLVIVDISDPTSPGITSIFDTEYSAYGVAVEDNYAYLTAGDLIIVNVSDPASPTFVSSFDTDHGLDSVVVEGNFAYVTDLKGSLIIVDVSDPTSPTLAGTYNSEYDLEDIDISGDYAYMAAYEDGLVIFNISDPASPTIVSVYDTFGYALSVDISNNYSYIADAHWGLAIIDVSDPTKPELRNYYDTTSAQDAVVYGNSVYLTDVLDGVIIFDISNPTIPELSGNYDVVDFVENVDVSGNYAYVAGYDMDVFVYDISNHTSPALAGTYHTTDTVKDIAFSGNYAYIAVSESGLVIVDISDPTSPLFVGKYNTAGWAQSVAVSGNYAYIADFVNGLVIVDVSNPSSPSLSGHYDSAGYAYSVSISGDYAYVADGSNGLVIVDISNPVAPDFVGHYDSADHSLDVAISGDYAYVADDHNGLVIVDISNPASPSLFGKYNDFEAQNVVVSNDYVYVAAGNYGFVMVDISNPALPSIVGYYYRGYANNVAVSDDCVCIAGFYNGVVILSTEIPSEPSDSQPPSSTSSSTSSSSGGGGGATGETYENIAFKDVRTEFVEKDSVTSYDFTDDNNEVGYIQFTASRNWGKITATIECLHDTSALVGREPDGIVYRNLNIWVGKSGFSDPDNIRDCVIGFKVSRSWLLENRIDESTIRLLHYSSGEWEELETDLVDADDEYLHFEAITPEFSPFAIVGNPHEEVVEDAGTKMAFDSANEQEVSAEENATESQSKSTPAFGSITCMLAIFLASYYMVLRKRS